MPRPKLSDEEKRKRGTLQKCRSDSAVPAPLRAKEGTSPAKFDAEPPTWLRADAKKAWRLAISDCSPGHLRSIDFTVLERWARTYNEWRVMAKKVEGGNYFTEDGFLSSEYKAYIQLGKVLAQCEKELGFTPASRVRLRLPNEKEEEESEYDDF